MNSSKEFYLEIENPIDNKDKWNKVLNIYSTSLDYDDFYDKIVGVKNYLKTEYNEDDKAKFLLMMWSLWKKKVLFLNDDSISSLIEKKECDLTIYDVIENVKNKDSIRSLDDLKDALKDNKISKSFAKMYKEDDSDITIYSNIDLTMKKNFDIVLSVKVSSVSLYKFLLSYVNKCLNNELEFLIKFNEGEKNISIDIYSTLLNARKNITILNTLKKENYTFFEENTNLLLVGNYNNWIAIRSKTNLNYEQYLKRRSQILFKSFDSVIYNYVLNHLNILVSYKDGRMNLVEYIAKNVMEKVTSMLLNNNSKTEKDYMVTANSEDFIKFKDYIKSKLAFAMREILDTKLYLKDGYENVEFKLNNTKNIDIEVRVFMSAVRTLILTLISKDSGIEKTLKTRIKNECQFYKVDPEKFCLDMDVANKVMFNQEMYDTYRNELKIIHEDVEKFNNLDNLINNAKTPEERKEIFDSYNDLLNQFDD